VATRGGPFLDPAGSPPSRRTRRGAGELRLGVATSLDVEQGIEAITVCVGLEMPRRMRSNGVVIGPVTIVSSPVPKHRYTAGAEALLQEHLCGSR
jgi:hypothetical protein